MGRIIKYGMERLERRHFEVSLDCPNCGSARIVISGGNGSGGAEDVSCPKCGILVVLDGLYLSAIDEKAESIGNGIIHEENELKSSGAIL